MKKALIIMAAALLFTQCRKQETTPVTPAAGTVKMTITAGPGRTDINTADGSITWSAGDKLYVSDGTSWLGSLTLVGEGGSAQGTFTGSIAGIGEGGMTCHFFYLGHDNGMTVPTAGTSTGAVISFAEQDGTLAGAMKYHTGHGTTAVTVTEGEATGAVVMDTKIAIAHLNLTTDGTTAYKGALTMGGTGISNTLSVTPDGTFSGSGEGGILIGNGTTGERYVTLIPTTGTDRVNVAFTGATGSMTFLAGIRENKFYGMKDAMAVTVKPVFSVAAGTKVEFAPGNLYWNGSAFCFEENQWKFTTAWNANEVDRFLWSKDQSVAVGTSTSVSGGANDVFFTNATETTAKSDFTVNGEKGVWRTLSKGEWEHLLFSRTDANRFAKGRVSYVNGLLIFPDGYTLPSGYTADGGTGMGKVNKTDEKYPSASIETNTWKAMESSGVVFLPAAGYRVGANSPDNTGSDTSIQSSTPVDVSNAYRMYCNGGDVKIGSHGRLYGISVRLVR